MKRPLTHSAFLNRLVFLSFALCSALSLIVMPRFHNGAKRIEQNAKAPAVPSRLPVKTLSAMGNLPLSFEANVGQTDAAVSFIAHGPTATFFLTASGIASDEFQMRFLGANPTPGIAGIERVSGETNYFIGNDPAKWKTDVAQYARVKYTEVYPGIDLVLYGNQRQLEYDFVVAPGSDPSRIRLAFEPTTRLEIESDGTLIATNKGGRQIRQHRPIVYQEIDGKRHQLAGTYSINARHEVELKVSAYDRSRPLVIDPILTYSTFLGGATPAPNELVFNGASAVAVDSDGNIYIAGFTSTVDFPTANPQQAAYGGGAYDVIVAKFNPSGSALLYSTYLGGANDERAFGIAVDSQGNAYVAGFTGSPNFPTTPTSVQPVSTAGVVPGNSSDAFVTKLSPTGTLIYSTFLGGNTNAENAYGIAVDSSGCAYVTGETASTDFPTKNAFQPSLATGGGLAIDAFVSKLSADGSALVYSTYLGGGGSGSGFSSSGVDEGFGIAVDSSGSAYVTGYTYSSSFPTQNPLQTNVAGDADIFVTKFTPDGTALVYSTYLGGSGLDMAFGIAVDASGDAYLTGKTASADFPAVNAFQPTYGGGDNDTFVAKVNPTGSTLVYSTFLGGSGSEGNLSRIALDNSGDAYIVGTTDSTNFPIAHAIQSTRAGPGGNAFVTKLNPDGNGLVYSTYLGGNSLNLGFGIAVDTSGSAYVSGQTWSANFPTKNPFQGRLQGTDDAFIAKIIEPPPVQLISVVSRKTHGDAGAFDLDLALAGSPAIECRSGGANGDHTLVFSFLNSLNAVSSITATATTSSGTQTLPAPGGSIGTDAHEYFVNLTGVPNASHVSVTLNGVTDSAGNFGDVSAQMDVLLGDVNSTGRADSGDVTAVRNHTVSVPAQQTFQFDVNLSGRIDSGDVTATRNATVTVLP